MSGAEGEGLLVTNLTEFFRDTVVEAMDKQGLDASDETEFYLVNLLETFTKAERLHDNEGDEALALLYKRAIESPSDDEAIPVYRRIGDVSLYMSGFFSRRLRHKAVSQSYVQEMGRGAYDVLHSLMTAKRAEVFASIYAELAEKFPYFVEVFIEVSETHSFSASDDTADLLARWAEAGSARASDKLIRNGLLPLWQFDGEDDAN